MKSVPSFGAVSIGRHPSTASTALGSAGRVFHAAMASASNGFDITAPHDLHTMTGHFRSNGTNGCFGFPPQNGQDLSPVWRWSVGGEVMASISPFAFAVRRCAERLFQALPVPSLL